MSGKIGLGLGLAVSPFEIEEWTAATGMRPDTLMVFESWDKQRTLADSYAKARSLGYRNMMVTWEPWTPTDVNVAGYVQGLPQPDWSNAAIAAGVHDAYIRGWAKSIRDSGLDTVWIRWGHEMDGGDLDAKDSTGLPWYPWSYDPVNYRAAWRRITMLFREQFRAKASTVSVRWMWSPNAGLYRSAGDWTRRAFAYWPEPLGAHEVDAVGLTTLNFGTGAGANEHKVPEFQSRYYLANIASGLKPVVGAEVNVALPDASAWLEDVIAYCGRSWIPQGFVISQGTSRGGGDVMNWTFASGDGLALVPVLQRLQKAVNL